MTTRSAVLLATLMSTSFARSAAAQSTRHHPHGATSTTTQTTSAPAPTPQPAAPPPAAAPPPVAPAPPASNVSLWQQPGQHNHDLEFTLSGFVTESAWGWAYGGVAFGPAFRASIPLADDFFHRNNDLRLTFGVMLFLWPYETVAFNLFWWISSPIALQANFYVSTKWSVLIEAGVLLDYYPVNDANCYDHPTYYCDTVLPHPLVGIGARYHFSHPGGFPTLTLRFEYPTGLEAGISF